MGTPRMCICAPQRGRATFAGDWHGHCDGESRNQNAEADCRMILETRYDYGDDLDAQGRARECDCERERTGRGGGAQHEVCCAKACERGVPPSGRPPTVSA
jgi:hypothetical protein